MITKLVLRNFKSIREQTYDLTDFDLLVGRNNCGKSTILQALAIWQFCVNEFDRAKGSGKRGKQVVLPNFTALPVPEFNLLWHEKVDRRYPMKNGKKAVSPDYILIEIDVTWLSTNCKLQTFGVSLRYGSPQSVYAIPALGWSAFRDAEQDPSFPRIAYVPPFSGLEPVEEWRDDGPIRKQIGKAQPGSILRNLLLKVCPQSATSDEKAPTPKTRDLLPDWVELKKMIRQWFSMELMEPQYEQGVDTQIVCEYKQNGKSYDIIAGGSGFHQALTLLAFLYGYKPTTMLLDEPDAHMHVNLQREILDYFKRKSGELCIQFLVATHAEELVKGVDASRVVSILSQKPQRLTSASGILTAMADVSNAELSELAASPFVLYVEGETDERILRAWAPTCDAGDILTKVCFHHMGGGTKKLMKEHADRHYEGVKQVIPEARRLMLFDFDAGESAFHPGRKETALFEWHRRNIENYLLVPDAWIRAAARCLNLPENDLFSQGAIRAIEEFFTSENLTLPRGQTWNNLSANVFQVVDGKRLLFEAAESLFARLKRLDPSVMVIRENVSGVMTKEEIHKDIFEFFDKLREAIHVKG